MQLTIFLILGMMLVSPQENTTAAKTRVTVHCAEASSVAGLPLRVLAFDAVRDALLPTDDQATFNADGEVGVDLLPGKYCFEVASVRDDDTIVGVHSNVITVPRIKSVKLVAGKPQALTLSHEGSNVELVEVAIRSAAAIGDVRWCRKSPGTLPKLVLTPGRNTAINIIGSRGPLHVAAWIPVKASTNSANIQLDTQSQWSNCRFIRRPGSPDTRSVTATIIFPDSRIEIPVTESTRVVTNRRSIMMGYRVELEDGKCLEFEPLPYNVRQKERFEVCGDELTPYMWAAYVWEEDGGKWFPHLTWRLNLCDPGGHSLNIYTKNCGVIWSARRVDGRPIPSGRVDDEERKRIGELGQAIRVKLEWVWNGNHTRDLSPNAFVSLRSQHFKIEAVPAWTWRSQNYLMKLERYYDVERLATGRRGPASIQVDWRDNTHNAKAIIGRASGGQERVWSSLPFRGYENNHEPFDEPWFVGHELLHTFGYHHGEEMSRLQSLVEFQFSRYRWYIVDHPETVSRLAKFSLPMVAKKPSEKKTPPMKKTSLEDTGEAKRERR